MRNIDIDFAQPFEKVFAKVLSLPAGCSNGVTNRLSNEAELKRVIRGLYEAAHGRQVETNIGLIMIAPPAYAFLKEKPFAVTTQTDLLIEAATRLIAGPAITDGRRAAARRVDWNERCAPPQRAHASEPNDSSNGSTRRPLVQATGIPLMPYKTSLI